MFQSCLFVSRTCGYPGCNRRIRFLCSGCEEVKYCSKKHQKAHWPTHEKICTKPEQEASTETDCEHARWPVSLCYLSHLESACGFNNYFRIHFDGNERSFMRWKKSFDILEIGSANEIERLEACEALEVACHRSSDQADAIK
ncbi:hypothetical protein TrLO_g15589 [Triparma laevis f. longispina]|uniref:MYND-type domain-containing protein n=1 Tax=Triparma laevis f. longispina TaxID=1714387 RepID=A0A9W7FDE0_9STRA|nr:hypothetical protein TrLO_g15589 [Triparma laevis f. longispina]